MVIVDSDTPWRVLAVQAHPDDVDFNAAGTVAKWIQGGADVTYLLVTSGDAGGYGSVGRGQISAVRRQEQREAAAAVGVQNVEFLTGYLDGHVQPTEDLVRDVVRVIRRIRPHCVTTTSPERDWTRIKQGHPDHLAVGEAVARAVYPLARNPYAFPELITTEGLEAWTVRECWYQAPPHPNHAEDISVELDQKIAACSAHRSQVRNPVAIGDRVRQDAATNAARFGLSDVVAAELFLRVNSE